MFAETFDLKLDFVPGDANGAGLESCSDDHLQTALGNALKLGPDCRPLIARFCASGDCIHGVALNWNIGSDWRKVRQVSCPVKEEELKLRPRDSDSHVAPKVFLTGKGHRSAVAKAFRAGKRRRKWNEETRPVSAYWRWPHDKPISVESLDFRLIGLSVQAALNQPCQYAVNEFIYIYIIYAHTHTISYVCVCIDISVVFWQRFPFLNRYLDRCINTHVVVLY